MTRAGRASLLHGLYVIVNDAPEATAIARAALGAGVRVLQYRAKTGIDGARMPKPMDTQKAMAESTATSVGRSRSHGDRCTTWCGRQEVMSPDPILVEWLLVEVPISKISTAHWCIPLKISGPRLWIVAGL